MITNVDKQDEEKYKCTATNLVGQMTTESVLRLACKSMAYYFIKACKSMAYLFIGVVYSYLKKRLV